MPPTRKRRPKSAPPISVDFKFLMTQIRQKLEVERRGRDRLFYREVKRQFAKINMTQRPRANSLSLFSWKLFEGVSNCFWPGSVMPADKPPGIDHSRPYVNICEFRSLDTDDMSFEKLVEFIQYNGDTSFRWRRKSRSRMKQMSRQREKLRESSRSGNSRLNPIVLSPLPARVPSSVKAQEVTNIGPMARFIWDDDVEMTQVSPQKDVCAALFTQPQLPTLSIACRPGWNLNKKTTWIPSGGIRHDPYIIPEKVIASRLSDPNQSAPLGNVSFARVPEKDIEAFLSKFLGRGGVLSEHTNSSELSG